jgi:hypothetical protein
MTPSWRRSSKSSSHDRKKHHVQPTEDHARDIEEEASRIDAALNDKSQLTEPAAFASKVIAKRLREHPTAYLEFGPYWWAVKEALRAQGEDFGAADDEQIRLAYGGDLPALSCPGGRRAVQGLLPHAPGWPATPSSGWTTGPRRATCCSTQTWRRGAWGAGRWPSART